MPDNRQTSSSDLSNIRIDVAGIVTTGADTACVSVRVTNELDQAVAVRFAQPMDGLAVIGGLSESADQGQSWEIDDDQLVFIEKVPESATVEQRYFAQSELTNRVGERFSNATVDVRTLDGSRVGSKTGIQPQYQTRRPGVNDNHDYTIESEDIRIGRTDSSHQKTSEKSSKNTERTPSRTRDKQSPAESRTDDSEAGEIRVKNGDSENLPTVPHEYVVQDVADDLDTTGFRWGPSGINTESEGADQDGVRSLISRIRSLI